MARKSPSAPPQEPTAPLPAELLTGPGEFAARLAPTEPVGWRYLGVVAVAGVLAGVSYALLVRPAANLAAEVARTAAPGVLTHVTNVVGGMFLTALTFALMWALGRLGGGRESRSGEVYGASFAVFLPLYLLVIVWTLLTPGVAFEPAAVTGGGDAASVENAALRAAARTPAALALLTVTVVGLVVQFLLAYQALRVLTGSVPRALAGTLLPVLPALAVQLIAISPLLSHRWS